MDSAFLNGQFLIAMPGIGDPRFERSLILICAHDSDHAMGITVNRPVEGLTIPDLLERLEIKTKADLDDDLVLMGGPVDTATRLKLMSVPGAKSKKNDNEYISSELGFRYLTIFVADTNAAMTRLKKAGVAPLAKGPVSLPKELSKTDFLTVVRDPDGNLVELVGPKK